jgi:adenylate cyclase
MDDEELEAAGLYDPAVDPASRAELVRRCLEIGLTVDEIRDAGDGLIDQAIRLIIPSGNEQLTLDELAERSGVSISRVEKVARATGRFSGSGRDEAVFSELDVGSISIVGAAFDLVGEDSLLQMLRVSAAAMARVGDAIMSAFLTGVAAPATRDDESGLQLLEANVAGLRLLPEFSEMLMAMLTRYLREEYRPRSDVSLASALADGVDTRVLAIGFADLVGSTTLVSNTSLGDLNSALDVFERAATETIVAAGGRAVKFIGDEVMFRAPTVEIACSVGLGLIDFAREHPSLPPLRVGVAFGEVLTREGDFYGSVVNLAARITKLAPPNGLVTTVDATETLTDADDFTIESLGAIAMRGLEQPVELAAVAR